MVTTWLPNRPTDTTLHSRLTVESVILRTCVMKAVISISGDDMVAV